MAVGFPTKDTFVNGDVYSAGDVNDLAGTLNTVPTLAGFAAGKNKIINGDFGIWQRGTSFSGVTTNIYTADRFALNMSGATATISRETFTPGTAPVAGYESSFFLRFNVTSADDNAGVNQPIEDVRTLAGQTATFSFYAKADTNRTVFAQFQQIFGSGGSAAVNVTASTISITSSWARYTYTVAIPSIAGKTIGTSSYLRIQVLNPNNETFTLDTWGWQVEAGSSASAFQTATGTIQGELAACQRYYQRITTASNAGYLSTLGSGRSTTVARVTFAQKQTFRVAPTSVDYSNVALSDGVNVRYVVTSVTLDSLSGLDVVLLDLTSSGLTQVRPYWAMAQSAVVGYIGLSAEL